MSPELSFSPVGFTFLGFLALSVLINFLLETYSLRLSMGTGKLQSWFFNHLGQSLGGDFFIGLGLQFISFRKRAFFKQLLSFISVGSLTKPQILFLVLGSLAGVGGSVLILIFPDLRLGLVLWLSGLILNLIFKEKVLKDVAFALGALGFCLLSLCFLNQLIDNSSFPFAQYSQGRFFPVFCLIVSFITTSFFRTPLVFLLSLSALHYFMDLDRIWFPLLFFFHFFVSLFDFYWNFFRGYSRLRFSLWIMGGLQVLQIILSFVIFSLIDDSLSSFFQGLDFIQSFQTVLLSYFIFFFSSSCLLLPFVWLVVRFDFLKTDKKKEGSQKIIFYRECFSIHLCFFLLGQELKKSITTLHTLLKLSCEVHEGEKDNYKRFGHYQAVSFRVFDELKRLCSNIASEKLYERQTRSLMKSYYQVQLMEQMTRDLSKISDILHKKVKTSQWESDCVFGWACNLNSLSIFLCRWCLKNLKKWCGLRPIRNERKRFLKNKRLLKRKKTERVSRLWLKSPMRL